MTNIGYAVLQIVPSLSGVSSSVEKQLDGLDGIGKKAGKKLGDNLKAGVEAAAKEVEQATERVVAARKREEDAAGKLKVAEAQLESLRKKGVEDSGRLAVAEEKVAAAKRNHTTVSTSLAKEVVKETVANDKLTEAKKRVEAASSGWGKIRAQITGMRGDVDKATGAIGGLAGKLTGIIGMGSVLSLPGMALAKGFQRLQSIDEAKAKLVALGQDTATVDMVMKNALASVDKTKFGLGDAASVAGMIVGAGVKPGQELERTLKQVADTAAITGGSLDDIGAIYGKVAAQGKLDGEVMNQLLERQIGILPKLAEHYKVSTDQAKKMVSDGKVSFADFQTVMDKLVGGGAQKMGKTFGATLDNMYAALGRLGAAVLGPGFDKLPGVFDGMTRGADAITPKLKAAGEVLSKYSGWITPIAAGIGAVVTGMVAWKVATIAITAVQTALNVVLAANPIGLVVLAIVGLGTALVVAYKNSETFRNIVTAVWDAVKSVIGGVVGWFTDTAWPAVKGAWDWITDAFSKGKELIGVAIDGVKAIWQGLMDKAGQAKDWIVDKFNGMVDFFNGLPGKIADAAKGMWDGLKAGLVKVLNWIGEKWNAFADKFSLDLPGDALDVRIPKVPLLGFTSGGYTGSSPANAVAGVVHGGEFVIRKQSTDRIENLYPGLLDYLNGKGALPGYQGGGRVQLGNISGPGITTAEQQSMWDAVRTAFPNAVLSSATRTVMTEGHKDFHNAGRAIDISGPGMGAVAAWIARNYPDSLELIHSPFGHNIKGGKDVGDGVGFYGAGQMAAHRDHVHWALGRSATPPKVAESVEAMAPDVVSSIVEDVGPAEAASMKLGSVPGSLSGLSSFGFDGIGAGLGTTKSGKDLSEFGKAAGSAVSGQVASALNVFGVGDSPGWLQGVSSLIGGISFGGGSTTPNAARSVYSGASAAASAIGSIHSGSGAAPGQVVNYNIRTALTEDAFVMSQRQEKERAAAVLDRF